MKIIKLKSNGVGRYDDVSPFIITDRSLNLKITLPPVNGDFYLIAENNGATQKHLLPESGEIKLDNLYAGELNAEVKHYLKGTLIKAYKVETLLIKEADGSLTAEPEISSLDRRICAVERNLNAFKQSMVEYKKSSGECAEEIKKGLVRVNKNILAIIRFAFKAYSVSPFLGGGTIDKFTEEFGFELSNEEINLIKGDSQDD